MSCHISVLPHFSSHVLIGGIMNRVPVAWLKWAWLPLRIKLSTSLGSVTIRVVPSSLATSLLVIPPRVNDVRYLWKTKLQRPNPCESMPCCSIWPDHFPYTLVQVPPNYVNESHGTLLIKVTNLACCQMPSSNICLHFLLLGAYCFRSAPVSESPKMSTSFVNSTWCIGAKSMRSSLALILFGFCMT